MRENLKLKSAAISVMKMNGEKVKFDPLKLRLSLERSGANEIDIQRILDEIQKVLFDGIPTKEIYKKAFALLRRTSRPTAARYKLKKAIYELGPTGFPFEKFVSAILSYEGYETEVGVIVQGNCVSHEIDVIAQKGNQHFMIECKFHSESGRFCNVKIPLYIQSRFKDVETQWEKLPGHGLKFHQGWVVTNTRFSSDALQFGICVGMYLLSWDYPRNNSLKERIDKSGLHPLTCLTTLTKNEKQQLLDQEIVLCMELCKRPELLKSLHISSQRQKGILKEANDLCRHQ